MTQHDEAIELAKQRLTITQNLIYDYLDQLADKTIYRKTNWKQWPRVHINLLLKGIRQVEHLLCEMQDLYDVINQ